MHLGGGDLRINSATSAAGSLKVAVTGIDGTPLPGYGLSDMDEIFGDELDRTVRWRGGRSLGSLSTGSPVRLLFLLQEADLFAFRMA
jgi:hypothetical protein